VSPRPPGLLLAVLLGCAPAMAAASEPAAVAPPGATGGAPALSSQRDYLRDGERDAPVQCLDADIAPFRGRTMADLFGAHWPRLPATGARVPARLISAGRITPPRGLEHQRSVVVVASLVDAEGRPARVEAICLSAPGFDTAAKRAARTARFQPATVDGVPVASVLVVPYVFRPSTRSVQKGTAD